MTPLFEGLTAKQEQGLHLLISGSPGAGKSTFASQFPKPVYVMFGNEIPLSGLVENKDFFRPDTMFEKSTATNADGKLIKDLPLLERYELVLKKLDEDPSVETIILDKIGDYQLKWAVGRHYIPNYHNPYALFNGGFEPKDSMRHPLIALSEYQNLKGLAIYNHANHFLDCLLGRIASLNKRVVVIANADESPNYKDGKIASKEISMSLRKGLVNDLLDSFSARFFTSKNPLTNEITIYLDNIKEDGTPAGIQFNFKNPYYPHIQKPVKTYDELASLIDGHNKTLPPTGEPLTL